MNIILDEKDQGDHTIPRNNPSIKTANTTQIGPEYIVPTLYPTHSSQTKYPLSTLLESPYPPFENIPTTYPDTNYPGTAVPSELGRRTYAYLHDDNHNVTGLADSQGKLVEFYEYDAYGRCRHRGPETTGNPLRYSSEYYDETLGLVFYANRCYNPLDGRWLSKDPIGEEGGANLYGFVGNNPVNRTDLLGLKSTPMSWKDYVSEFEKKQEDKWKYLSEEQKKRLKIKARRELENGCIGITEAHLGSKANYDHCFRLKSQAENKRKELAEKNKVCQYRLFSVHLWNDKGRNPDKPDVSFDDKTGQADMENWNRSPKAPGLGAFDYGYLDETGPNPQMIHADGYQKPGLNSREDERKYMITPMPPHPDRNATVYKTDPKDWPKQYGEDKQYNTEVWCVQCENSGSK